MTKGKLSPLNPAQLQKILRTRKHARAAGLVGNYSWVLKCTAGPEFGWDKQFRITQPGGGFIPAFSIA